MKTPCEVPSSLAQLGEGADGKQNSTISGLQNAAFPGHLSPETCHVTCHARLLGSEESATGSERGGIPTHSRLSVSDRLRIARAWEFGKRGVKNDRLFRFYCTSA